MSYRTIGVGLGALALSTAIVLRVFAPGALTLAATGEARDLGDSGSPAPLAPAAPRILVLALDGVDRELLYPMLRDGSLPELATLLGGQSGGAFPHAHFDEHILSTLPSSTLAAWATIFTGTVPAEHGVAGNEYFVRENKTMAAPAPVSILDPEPVLTTYTEGYANQLLAVPTLYENLRARDAATSAWVSMSQFHQGADKLLLADRTVIAAAFKGMVEGLVDDADMQKTMYAQLDDEAVDTVEDALKKAGRAPQILTVYLTGTDYVAHGAELGPNPAREKYLRQVTDRLAGRLHRALEVADAGVPRWVVLVSDHGHTAVLHDEAHALSTGDRDDPPAVVRGAGFRLRPFTLRTKDDADFQAVLAYGGAMAYVYAADRSGCMAAGTPCDFKQPPRYEQDVVPLAQAFYDANASGTWAPSMRGALDMVLVRKPVPYAEIDAPFEVYLGAGRTEALPSYLAHHPHPSYERFPERLRELAVGRYGERAGDVLLLARNGDEKDIAHRYYFANLYRSWHGSPSHADSAISLIAAHPGEPAVAIGKRVAKVFGATAQQADVGRLIQELVTAR